MREFPNATPRPWKRIGWMPCGLYGPGDIVDADRVATIDRQTEHDDNAALIVHAVNTYEEREMLLEEAAEALRASQEAFEALGKHLPQVDVDVVTGFRIVEANQKARAFLAKLEARDA